MGSTLSQWEIFMSKKKLFKTNNKYINNTHVCVIKNCNLELKIMRIILKTIVTKQDLYMINNKSKNMFSKSFENKKNISLIMCH